MDYKKKAMAYDEALERAKKATQARGDVAMDIIQYIFPELRESEDEKIIKGLENFLWCIANGGMNDRGTMPSAETCQKWLAFLERQKANSDVELSPEDCKLIPQELISVCNDIIAGRPVLLCADKTGAGKLRTWLKQLIEKQKEQRKETLRDFIDNFPYSDEQKEQNLNPSKSVGLKEQKPAEWSEEDEEMLNSCISSIEESKENRYAYKENDGDTSYDREIAWLKSLRPQPQGTYKQVIHTIFGMLKDKDFYEIQPSYRVSLLNDIRVKCKDAIVQ